MFRLRKRNARGAVSVEFAATVPLVAVVLLMVAQVGLLVSEQLAVQHAAREGARAAALWNDDQRARDAVLTAGNLDAGRTTIEIQPATRVAGTPVSIIVHYRPVTFPFIGAFVPDDLQIASSATMRTERG